MPTPQPMSLIDTLIAFCEWYEGREFDDNVSYDEIAHQFIDHWETPNSRRAPLPGRYLDPSTPNPFPDSSSDDARLQAKRAVETLVELTKNGSGSAIRLQAAQALLHYATQNGA